MSESRWMIGIDPGATMALAVAVEKSGRYLLPYYKRVKVEGKPMGFRLNMLYKNLAEIFGRIQNTMGNPDGILIELHQGTMIGRNSATQTMLVRYIAVVEMACDFYFHGVPCELIDPKKWQFNLFGIKPGMKGIDREWLKAASIKLANIRFEGVEITDDNIADASNIAAYGFSHYPRKVVTIV